MNLNGIAYKWWTLSESTIAIVQGFLMDDSGLDTNCGMPVLTTNYCTLFTKEDSQLSEAKDKHLRDLNVATLHALEPASLKWMGHTSTFVEYPAVTSTRRVSFQLQQVK